MGKIYWNNLDVELEGVISAVGGVTNSSGSFPSELEIIVPK